METLLAHSLDHPDERMEFADGRLDIVRLGDRHVGRLTLEPGWRWSRSVAPLAGTDSCPAPHLGYVVSGRLHVRMDDGSQGEAGPGDAFWIAPGHDAWVVGDEPVVLVDVEGAAPDGAA
jgi:hypothetical protein